MKNQATKIFGLLALATTFVAAQSATNDLFNRPNSGSLGVDWIEQDGDSKIANNKLEANSPFGFGWCSHSAFSANYAGVVVRCDWSMNGGGGDRVSLIAGVDVSSWSGIEVRIADNNGDGLADRIFFNAAVNAGAWYSSPSFTDLATPIVSGRATMWFSNGGDTVNLALRSAATGLVETVSKSGILAAPPTGTRVGVGYFGNGMVDDFQAWTGSPTGPVMTFTTARSNLPATLLVTDMAPFSNMAVAYSTTGAGIIPTPLGNVGLSLPISILFETATDAFGRLEVVYPAFGSLTGYTIHVQAVDLTTPSLTNYFTVVFI